MKYITDNEIACESEENAMAIAKLLMDENYVVMVSKEEQLTIVNYEYSDCADRNDVVFLSREEFEVEWFNLANENPCDDCDLTDYCELTGENCLDKQKYESKQ